MPYPPILSRRAALKHASACVGALLGLQALKALPVVAAPPTLGGRAAAKGLLYGTAVEASLFDDNAFAAIVAEQCQILVHENALKWRAIRPAADSFDFTLPDRYMAFARQHGLRTRGHTLVWHRALPTWLDFTATRSNAEQLMTTHIARVAGYYAGHMHSWDVVNEAINLGDDQPDGMRNSLWYKLLGPQYVATAFRAAAAADPHALLLYNDYGLDFNKPTDEAKRKAVLKLLYSLKKQDVPIHGFGMQAHLSGDGMQYRFKAKVLQDFFREIADMGLKIMITELDIHDKKLKGNTAQRDKLVAQGYRRYLDAALTEPAVIGVLTWGLSDRYTWLQERGKRPVRALPFDSGMRRKPVWSAIAAAFDAATAR
jgi:endo-1,4-beta-xylanase